MSKSKTIAALNDQCRQAWGVYPNTRVFMPQGIQALSGEDRSAIAEKVQTFDSFTRNNDPHHEHDFGSFEHNGEKIFWKMPEALSEGWRDLESQGFEVLGLDRRGTFALAPLRRI